MERSAGFHHSDAFDRLFQNHYKQAYVAAYRMTGNAASAEDLTQETFLRAFRFFDHYRPDCPFEKWLSRIMSNRFIDEYHRKPRMKTVSLSQRACGQGGEDTLCEIPDRESDPERILMRGELDENFQRALENLPDLHRQTVILADIEGLSYQEISSRMSCTLGAVRSRLSRGRTALRNSVKTG